MRQEVRQVRLSDISPSPENDTLYMPVNPQAPDIIELASSIAERGVLEPLVLSTDGYILSGHRRFVAARLAGKRAVPARVDPVSHDDHPDEFVRHLREYNRQREKTSAEKFREEVVSTSPEAAYASLIAQRRQAAALSVQTVPILGIKRRKEITDAKEPLLLAVEQVLFVVLKDYWPTSIRKIHYELLNLLPLVHASKPDSTYTNTRNCYQSLSELLTRARLVGRIPWEAITDETRPVEYWDVHLTIRGFVRQQLDRFLRGYWRDLMQSQPNHIECVCEKNTVVPIVTRVTQDYCIPTSSGRGFAAIDAWYKVMQRYQKSGKDKLVLLMLTDFDPEGENILQVAGRTMRDDFGVKHVEIIKVAITQDQVLTYNLPPDNEAKSSSSRYREFVGRYGPHVYELEALSPQVQQALLRQAIDEVIDVDAFNAELEREKHDASWLRTLQQKALAVFMNIMGDI